MSWSVRVARVLTTMGLVTVGDLVKKSAKDFAGLPNFGPKSLREITTTLTALGLTLAQTESGAQAPLNNFQATLPPATAPEKEAVAAPTHPLTHSPTHSDEVAPRRIDSCAPIATPMPDLLSYKTRSGERWRCERFALLAAEYLKAGETDWGALMMLFHEVASRFPRSWMIVRRLFAISPAVLPVDASPDDYLPMTRGTLMAAMGLTLEQLQAELDALRAVWINARVEAERGPGETAGRREGEMESAEMPLSEDGGTAVLHEFGFDESAFDLPGRAPELNSKERAWFVIRVEQMRKMLVESMTANLTRAILINELTLRRLESEVMGKQVGTAEWRRTADSKRELEQLYLSQLSDLNDIYPWKAQIGGKINFKGCISEMNTAKQQYYANGDTRLVDKIRTAGEIDIDFRQSQQSPEPRYRYGQNLYLIESMDPRNLWDPNFQSQFKYRTLKKVDFLAKNLIDQARLIMGEELVDLLKDEYPDASAPVPPSQAMEGMANE
jgi:hypothetical protein